VDDAKINCIFVIVITSPVELWGYSLARRSIPHMRYSGSTFLLRLSPAQAGLFLVLVQISKRRMGASIPTNPLVNLPTLRA
jgi:hypothetical protein